jgi:hypothetical protein
MKKIPKLSLKNLKYSNDFLFDRREKEKELTEHYKTKGTITTQSHSKDLSQYPYIKTYYTITTNPSTEKANSIIRYKKMRKLLNSNIDFYNNIQSDFNIYNNSNYNNFNQRSSYSNNNSKHHIYQISNYSNSNSDFNYSNFYITDTPFKSERMTKSKILKDFSIEEKQKEEDKNLIRLLRSFEESNNKKDNEKKSLINNKIISINNKHTPIKKFINQTREKILLKYTSDIKNEISTNLNEMYKNEIERVDNYIKSMKKTNKLFNDTFLIKFNDYVKELEIQREIEKSENTNLIKQIIKQKIENSQIESKIRKQELEKDNILRWIFFQISVKENKLNIPNHYKSLIEETEENMRKIFENPSNFLEEKNIENKGLKKQNTRKKVERKSTRKSINFLDKIVMQSLKGNTINPISIYKNITMKEAQRIRDYKYNLCYESPEDFMDALKKYEFSLMNYLEVSNKLKISVKELKDEKIEFQKQLNLDLKQVNDNIKKSEFALQLQKDKYDLLYKEKEQLKISMLNFSNNQKKKEKRISIYKLSLNPYEKIKPNLYNKIQNLYETCSQIPLTEVIKRDFISIKKIYTKQEEEMIDMLTEIELIIDYLLFKQYDYKNVNGMYYDLYKRIQSSIEHNRKIEKNKKQKQDENDRLSKLIHKIEIRDNKIYFLPRRKIEQYGIGFQRKKYKSMNENENKNPEIVDFLYDEI